MGPQHTVGPSAGQHSQKGPVQTEDLVLMGGHCVEWDSWAAWGGEGRATGKVCEVFTLDTHKLYPPCYMTNILSAPLLGL